MNLGAEVSGKNKKYLAWSLYLPSSLMIMFAYTNCTQGLSTAPVNQSQVASGSSDNSSGSGGGGTAPGQPPAGTIINVSNSSELLNAIASASPGHVITLAAGTYTISRKVNLNRAGSSTEPITLRSDRLGDAVISVNSDGGYAEGFVVNAPYWIIENLEIVGTCPQSSHSFCEHAVHIKGTGDNLIVRSNIMREFNAMIKGSGNPVSGGFSVFADDVQIRDNRMQNSSARMTSNPVALIDINGGQRWRVQENRIIDFAKGAGDGVSYGAFLKGNSRDGIFERNLIVCSKNHSGGARIGLSFGGGGNSPETNNPICEQNTCTNLHTNGIMRNNIIVDCSDVGIYLNRSASTKVYNNTLINTNGIDVRFSTSSADIRNNISNSTARIRDGGTITTTSNNIWNVNLSNIFNLSTSADVQVKDGILLYNQGVILSDSPQDFCGRSRQVSNDIGAIQYGGNPTVACAMSISSLYSTF